MRQRAVGFLVLAAAVLSEIVCSDLLPAAQTQQSKTQQVAETGPPQPFGGVKRLVDESGWQLQAQNFKDAQALADEALRLAIQENDAVAEALAQHARSEALGRLSAKSDQIEAYLAAANAWRRADYAPGEVEMLGQAGACLVESGKQEGSVHLRQALSRGRQETRWPLAMASAFDVIALHLFDARKQQEAIEFSQAALDLREKLVPDSLTLAESLYVRGKIAREFEHAGAADQYLRRALAIQERLTPGAPELGNTLKALGNSAMDQLDLPEARKNYRLALELYERAGSNWDSQKAATLNNLGRVALHLRDLPAADRYYSRAVAIMERIDPASTSLAVFVSGKGDVAYAAGDWARAQKFYRTALAIAEKTRPDGLAAAQTLDALGRVVRIQGDLDSARYFTERAVRLLEKDQESDLVFALQSLALIAAEQGDLLSAEETNRRALSLEEKIWGGSHPFAATFLESMAFILARQGRSGEAVEVALEAESRAREHARLMIQSLSEREALIFAVSKASGLDHALPIVATNPSSSAEERRRAFDSLIRSRALVFDEMAMRYRTAHIGDQPETAQLAGRMAAARTALAKLIVRGPDSAPEEYARKLDSAWQQKEVVESALAEKNRSFGQGLLLSRAGIDEIALSLPPRTALLAFARFGGTAVAPASPLLNPPRPSAAYMAFVLRSGEKEPAAVALGSAAEVDVLVLKLRDRIAEEERAAGRAARRNEAAYRATAAALRRKIWDPIAPHLKGMRQVFIVPDDALHLVNFAALPTGQSGYLLETGPRIHYLSAERNLVSVKEQGKKGVGLLAVGAPTFQERSLFAALRSRKKKAAKDAPLLVAGATKFRGLRSVCDSFQAMQFEALPASAREVDNVATLWEGPGGVQASSVRLTGPAANEAAFKQQAEGKRVLHLATHGFFLGGNCPSGLGVGHKPSRQQLVSSLAENPLLRSGLALAGANHRQAAGPDEEDGILTAEEIAALDLSGVEWAVLSACDTGIGELKAGEGVLGLRRAFEVAGARTLIMSLWPVEDQVARDWMTQLYHARLDLGLATIDAVHQANLNALHRRRANGHSTHPFYWAGFVAAGDWR